MPVKVEEIAASTVFIVPGSTVTLLGSDFVKDAGLVLDFGKDL